MVKCKVCGKDLNMITNSHLRAHGLTPTQYMEKFPFAPMFDEKMYKKICETRNHVERPICSHPGCSNKTSETHNKYCSRTCSMSHRMSKDGRNEQSGMKNPVASNSNWYSIGKKRKKEAKERDSYRCRKCNRDLKEKRIHAHHMIPEHVFDTPEEAHALENLVTLCDHCHMVVGWETSTELYKRVIKFESLFADTPGYVKIREFIYNLLKDDNSSE